MHKKVLSTVLLWSFLLLSAMHCSTPITAGGSSSETVIGKVVNSDGSPACSSVITLYPSDYDPIRDGTTKTFTIDTTDASGAYCVEIPDSTNTYSIIARMPDSKTSAHLPGIIPTGDTTYMKDAILSMPGSITLNVPDSIDSKNGYLYIPGTDISVNLNGNRTVLLQDVPSGTELSVKYAYRGSSAPASILADGIEVVSNENTVVSYPQWRFSRKLYLNTTGSGAAVSSNQYNFPVFVRLNADNFNFSEAKNNGIDIRFTKSNGSPLPYEIEQWDSLNNRAALWVKMDTVYGNDADHYIAMYWGAEGTKTLSDAPVVFDTADGFVGVWHLGITDGTRVPDATVNGIDGTAEATTATSGVIGDAQMFNGISSLIRASGPEADKLNFPEDSDFSVSAWVKTTVLDTFFRAIVFKSNKQYGLQIRPNTKWEFFNFFDNSRWEMSQAPVSDTSWHALTGVRNGNRQYLFVDGACVDSSIITIQAAIPREYTMPFEIGHCPDGGFDLDRYFNGIIDEVRVAKIACSADWIKLSYMNQKTKDELVQCK